ncbi:ISAon1 family transposase N-terminal region protein [Marinilabilia salmonicolor]|uniref:ISAon1 family transposase N-terminal region protein n=1 Tax=Marinilabilia salmonicolor TaxID=989 RepID=UPI000495F414|nr:hypothetical protein [Marinilabilia salmonicolor]
MKEDINQSLLELILPEGVLDHFNIVGLEKGESGKYVYDKTLTIYLEEKNKIPEEYKTYKYKSSGFMDSRQINDYPIRNMLVTLSVKRRRWDVEIDGKTKKVTRDWSLVAQGTRMSAEYAAFLKEISRF